jgi:hypothetical protein
MNIKVLTGLWVIIFLSVIFYAVKSQTTVLGGPGVVTWTASSTQYTMAALASQRLVATSSKRTGLTIQPVNCPTSGSALYLELTNGDTAAVSTTTADYVVFASSTAQFDDSTIPAPTNAVRGVVSSGTCVVIVTEYRTNY